MISETHILTPLPRIKISKAINPFTQILDDIYWGTNQCMDRIESAKIFIEINCDDTKFDKDAIIETNWEETFELLWQEVVKTLQKKTTQKFEIKWDCIIKNNDGTFAEAYGRYSRENTWNFFALMSNYYELTTHTLNSNPLIFNHELENIVRDALIRMGRNIAQPILNDENNFV